MSVDRLSRFRKVDEDEELWRKLNEFATTLEPLLKAAFIKAIMLLRGQISLEDLIELFTGTNPVTAAGMIVGRFEGAAFDTLRQATERQVLRSARFEQNLAGVKVDIRGFGTNPRALEALQQEGGRLITGVAQRTREAIIEHVRLGISRGENPRDFARDIRSLIGLTPRQAQAVSNYRYLLETGKFAEAMTRELRDHRHDKLLERGGKLTRAQIDKQVQDYYNRSLIWRSENIARTEAISALATGQRLMWLAATEQGVVDDLVRRWYVARIEGVCDICRQVPAMNPGGVGITQMFQTPNGPVYGPALHPQCRCTVFTRPRIG